VRHYNDSTPFSNDEITASNRKDFFLLVGEHRIDLLNVLVGLILDFLFRVL